MQKAGYFNRHPHYTDYFGQQLSNEDRALDDMILNLDFNSDEIVMPVPYSDALERSVKRTESGWLPKMFVLPQQGVALDVGCGFGRSLVWMAQRYDTVIGTDISAEVIQLAGRLCQHLDNVRLYTNDADALPAAISKGSVDVAYVFTVFQHIPREYALGLLNQIRNVLKRQGTVVFNLISNVNEDLNSGESETEWAIGYSREQALALLNQAGFESIKITRWSGPESDVSWLWLCARPTG